MSGSQELQPWSNDPNAPDITYMTYFEEKSAFAGNLIASILYGTSMTHPPTRPSARAHFACLVFLRIRYRSVLQMYDRPV